MEIHGSLLNQFWCACRYGPDCYFTPWCFGFNRIRAEMRRIRQVQPGNSEASGHTPAPFLARLLGVVLREYSAYFAAAAAAAFLVALAAVEALRRRLVLGGVAGA